MMRYMVRTSNQEMATLEQYAQSANKSVSDVLRESFLEMLEDELDIRVADEAYAVFLENPVTRSLDDVMKDNGL